MDDLENRPVCGRVIVTPVARNKMRLRHDDILEQDGAAECRALAETRPIVDHREAGRVAVSDGIPGATFVIERHDGNEMCKQCAGGIELLAVDDDVIAGVGEFCLKICGAF